MFFIELSRPKAVLLALFVTLLWSSSWVLIKFGLQEIPALTFAGLRYSLAFMILIPINLFSQKRRAKIRRLPASDWFRLALLGLVYYSATQGLIFVALQFLNATTLSLMLNFTSVVVALLGVLWLRELPSRLQWIGLPLFLLGATVYFIPFRGQEPIVGLAAGGAVVLANSAASLLGRQVNRSKDIDPMIVTLISMGIGSLFLLALGVTLQGLPRLSPSNWLIIGWLALVNSALAFTLWNATQRVLTATESSVINNTMLIQIAILGWLFLGESLTVPEVVGLVLAACGVLLVQLRGFTLR